MEDATLEIEELPAATDAGEDSVPSDIELYGDFEMDVVWINPGLDVVEL